jgi:aryl-alcohol dehydrogenase-like predicted oxidoreductase
MLTRQLGPWKLSALGLGGMPLSLQKRPPEAEAIALIHAALDGGITLIDTADVYCIDHRDIGHNERLIAKALQDRSDRANILVATKGGLERPGGDWTCNGRPEHMVAACNASLRALGVERIALYQIHAPDDDVPWAETVGAVARLREAGKIQEVGLSNVTVEQIEEARALVPVVSVQNRCHFLDRSAWEDGVIDHCTRENICFLAYSPVGGSGDYADIGADPRLNAVARAHGASPYEVALAWLLTKSPVMLPIPGASRMSSLRSILRAGELGLGEKELKGLE